MGNPMLNQLKQLPNNNNDLLSMLQNASNPQALIQNMISKNWMILKDNWKISSQKMKPRIIT